MVFSLSSGDLSSTPVGFVFLRSSSSRAQNPSFRWCSSNYSTICSGANPRQFSPSHLTNDLPSVIYGVLYPHKILLCIFNLAILAKRCQCPAVGAIPVWSGLMRPFNLVGWVFYRWSYQRSWSRKDGFIPDSDVVELGWVTSHGVLACIHFVIQFSSRYVPMKSRRKR